MNIASMRNLAIPASLIGGTLLLRQYIRGPMYKGDARIDGKTVLITGGNSGCGLETAKDLAKRGANIVLLCRDPQKAEEAKTEIKQETGTTSAFYQLDLSSLESVKNCASEIKKDLPKIDILINNAGIMACPRYETKDGFEMQFGTNHLGHFLLTILLLENIKAAAPSKIINLSSIAHEYGDIKWDDINYKNDYSPTKAYCQSKLCNILFTKYLAKLLKDDGITTYAVHPGTVNTNLHRHIGDSYGSIIYNIYNTVVAFFQKTPVLGAQTTVYCAVDSSVSNETGHYYWDNKSRKPTDKALDEKSADRLWDISMDLLKDYIPKETENIVNQYKKKMIN